MMCVCACFFSFFCYAYHSIVFVELCWMFNNKWYVLSQAFSMAHRWFQQDSQTRTKKTPIKWNMSPACCFSFSVILKRDDFREREQKRAEIDFFLFTICIACHNCQIDSFEQWMYEKKRMPTQEWHQICANILIAEDYWVCLWNHWNFNRKKNFFFFRHVLTLFGMAFYGLLDFAYTIQPNIAISSLILPKLLEIHSFSNPSI